MPQMKQRRRALIGMALLGVSVLTGCGGSSESPKAPSLLATPRRLENLKEWANPAEEGAVVLERWKNAPTRLDLQVDTLKKLGRQRLSGASASLCGYDDDVRIELHDMLDDLEAGARKLACASHVIAAVKDNLKQTHADLGRMKEAAKARALSTGERRDVDLLLFVIMGDDVPIRSTRDPAQVRLEVMDDVNRVASSVVVRSSEVSEVAATAQANADAQLKEILSWFGIGSRTLQPRCSETKWAEVAGEDDPGAKRLQTALPACGVQGAPDINATRKTAPKLQKKRHKAR